MSTLQSNKEIITKTNIHINYGLISRNNFQYINEGAFDAVNIAMRIAFIKFDGYKQIKDDKGNEVKGPPMFIADFV
eukprot:7045708-Ditylum_brightwellii.AAC.1